MKKNYKEKENIVDETLRLLSEKYLQGLYEFLFKYKPKMYKELRDLEDEITRGYEDKSVKDIKLILRRYWILHIDGIKEFENHNNLDLEIGEIKQQIDEELHAV